MNMIKTITVFILLLTLITGILLVDTTVVARLNVEPTTSYVTDWNVSENTYVLILDNGDMCIVPPEDFFMATYGTEVEYDRGRGFIMTSCFNTELISKE